MEPGEIGEERSPSVGRASTAASEIDWRAVCRRAYDGVRRALEPYGTAAERAVETGRGEGGDMALVIDRAAEDAVFAELEALGAPLTAISEERGEVALAGGGETRVVIDPIDGSLNAKRGLDFACLSIAVADGPSMSDVHFGFVGQLGRPREWVAARGEGAFVDGERLAGLEPGELEILALETARSELLAAKAEAIDGTGARRIRALGSVAISLCLVGEATTDAMLTLRPIRSVDAAAAQLVVLEAGGAVAFPDAGEQAGLGLDMRSRVFAARDPELLARLLGAF